MDQMNSGIDSRKQFEIQQGLWQAAISDRPRGVGILPGASGLARARASLQSSLPDKGVGFERTRDHILDDIVPGFNGGSISPNYYGFVTGGVTPAALFADSVVSIHDQNVQVHLPEHSIVTEVEDKAIGLLADLLRLDRQIWGNGTVTTGATASNVLGLACGREFVLREAAEKCGGQIKSVGENGFFEVLQAARLSGIQVLSTMPHSSLGKAAGILGIGRANLVSVSTEDDLLRFDMKLLEQKLAQAVRGSIVAISCGEVNTGGFATTGFNELQAIRRLCDEYSAWLHVDGAFGIFGRLFDSNDLEFASIARGCEGLELADSITGDAHKLLNVPYDCGFFLCRHPDLVSHVFRNPNAAYLSPESPSGLTIPSPLNMGIENSRRFRALPVYASLVAYGKNGYRDMIQRQVRLARMIAGWLFGHPNFTVFPVTGTKDKLLEHIFMVILFRANEETLNRELSKKINATSKIFISGTTWEGEPACRIAISNWRANPERDFALITRILDQISNGEG